MKPYPTLLLVCLLASCSAAPPPKPAAGAPTQILNLQTTLPEGKVNFDLYLPASNHPAPLVIVAHGFLRSKTNMAGWGQMLAQQGYIAAVPTLPNLADHPGNARAINQLTTFLCSSPAYAPRINPRQLAYIGFSAGGLSTLLAAADNPAVKLWIGLDPVDRDGLGLAALPRLQAQPFIFRADPSSFNANGNSQALIAALGPRCQSALITGAIHIDAEWPTDSLAELACGKSSDELRAAFASHALSALKSAFPPL